jgi:hypothetical protein
MRYRRVVEIETSTYAEQQFILNRFPQAVWIEIEENKTRFYLPIEMYEKVINTIKEWEKRNDKNDY